MPYRIVSVETTPNPNARKLIVDPSPGTIRSYFKADDALGDPLGEAIFSIPGVTNVLIHTGFISVSIAKKSDWTPTIKALGEKLGSVSDT